MYRPIRYCSAVSTEELQAVLRRIYDVDGVARIQTVVLEMFFERPVQPEGISPRGA